MDVDEQQHASTNQTSLVATNEVPAGVWLVLALALIAAVIVLQFDRIDAWFAPRAKVAMEEVRSSMPAVRTPPTQEARKPVARAPMKPASDARRDVTPLPTPAVPPAPVAATSSRPENAPAPQSLKPLYPASTAPLQASGPEGHAGIVEALRAGTLRPATGADIARWQSRYAMTHGRSTGTALDTRMRMTKAYVIKGDLTIPGGLHGAHAVIFLLEKDVPYPRGDAGHSAILDLNSGACIGVVCRSLLQ